jgi:malate/lactate dehydrogenase
LFAACGASIVVVADRAAAGEWQGEEGLMLLRRLMRDAGVVVCAGAQQRELVQQAVRELKMDRRRVLGSAPEALASSIRAIVAAEADRSPGDVGLAVLGVPPRHVVIPWEDATVGGLAATRLLDEPARRRIAARTSHLWPPGPVTLAAAAAKAVMAVLGRSRGQVCAFVAADDAMGMKTRAGAMPVLLGPAGVERIDEPTLSVHDRVALDNALML